MSAAGAAAGPRWPEHEKLVAVRDASQAVGEFLDLGRWTLCTWVEAGDTGAPRYVWKEGVEKCVARGLPVEGREPDNSDFYNGDAQENPEYDSWDGHWRPVHDIQGVLAEYFGIDQERLEQEKRAMLATYSR